MKRYEFNVLTVNRNQLRDGVSAEVDRLNGSHLVSVMERELD